MNAPMKSSVLQKKLGQLEGGPDIKVFAPDISADVESICCMFNAYVLDVRSFLLNILQDEFDKSMLNEKGETALLDMLDRIETQVETHRASFMEFHEEYKQLIKLGCKANSWAKGCLKNANSATTDLVKNFDMERERVLNHFYDSLPTHVRLGSAPIFGGGASPDIGEYLSSVVSR